ncbi:MAG TPA: hypothetical protein VML19_34985 [Verrucomicrobiae bacterium]|nr:hypothetical protein [Verrucomicrobiae bacterium]
MKRMVGVTAILVIGVWSAWAQSPMSFTVEQQDWDSHVQQMQTQLREMLANQRIMGVEGMVMGPAVKGAPYSAEESRETTQTLGDGTRIHNESKVSVYRDSQGRIRRETPTSIQIWDPIAEVSYSLDPKTMTYRKTGVHIVFRGFRGENGMQTSTVYVYSGDASGRVVSGTVAEGGGVVMPPDRSNLPLLDGLTTVLNSKAKKETLGNRGIEGLNCTGERSTSTIDAGAIGNDRPISSVSERWYSPELQVMVQSTKSDPRTGTEEFRLTNVRRGEPDPIMFQVPPGYRPAEPVKFGIGVKF